MEEFRRRRDFVVAGLNKIAGISCRLPHGAFYAFPNVSGVGLPSKQLADARGAFESLAGKDLEPISAQLLEKKLDPVKTMSREDWAKK